MMYQQYPYGGMPGAPQPKRPGYFERRKMAKQAQQMGTNPSVANYQQSLQMMQIVGKNNDVVQFLTQYPEILPDLVTAVETAVARLLQLQRKHLRTTITIPAHEAVADINGKPTVIKIPEVQAVLKTDFIDPDNKPEELSVHEGEYDACIQNLRPTDLKSKDNATLQSEFEKMKSDVTSAIQPPPELQQEMMYGPQYGAGPPYQEEPSIASSVGGLLADTFVYQATGKPRGPPPGPY